MSRKSRVDRLKAKGMKLRTKAMNADIAGKSGKAGRLEERAQKKYDKASNLQTTSLREVAHINPSTGRSEYKRGGHLSQYD
jgi:hypothetical protein